MSPIRQLPPELELADAIGRAVVGAGGEILGVFHDELHAGAQVLVASQADPDGLRRVAIGGLLVWVDLYAMTVRRFAYSDDRARPTYRRSDA